jgi:transcriptional regulator with XRE-family HTH domain
MDKSIHSSEYLVFLKIFKDARRRAGLTQEEFARQIGETQSFVSKCERGERRIDLVELRTMCRVLAVRLDTFIEQFEDAVTMPRRTSSRRSSARKNRKK